MNEKSSRFSDLRAGIVLPKNTKLLSDTKIAQRRLIAEILVVVEVHPHPLPSGVEQKSVIVCIVHYAIEIRVQGAEGGYHFVRVPHSHAPICVTRYVRKKVFIAS